MRPIDEPVSEPTKAPAPPESSCSHSHMCHLVDISFPSRRHVTNAVGRLLARPKRACVGLRILHSAIRGQERTGKNDALPPDVDWRSLADPATTTAIYMSTRTLAGLVAKALTAGLDPDTPAVAVARATRPDQRVIAARIADLPNRTTQAAPDGPVLVMIGRVCSAAADASAEDMRIAANHN